MYQVHKYNSLQTDEYLFERRPGNELLPIMHEDVYWRVRLHQFLRLIYHGHFIWIWKSGITFSLWTSGRKPFIRSPSEESEFKFLSDPRYLPTKVREYLARHIGGTHQINYEHHPCTYIVIHLYTGKGFKSSRLEYPG